MPQVQDLQRLTERLRERSQPLLSVYLNADPGIPENQGNAHLVRLKNALRDLGVPQKMADRVYKAVEEGPPRARTLVFFAEEGGFFEQYNLQIDLPESFDYGEVNLAPMALALQSYEPYAAALVDAEEVRVFVTELAETPGEATESHDPHHTGYRELDLAPSTPGPRGKTEHEAQSHRSSQHLREFYNQMGKVIRDAAFREGAHHLILAGPHERTSELREHLPNDIADRVIAEESIPMDGPDGEILERIDAARLRAERQRKSSLLASARESGVRGLRQSVEAMNEGRIYHLLVLWDLDAEMRWCDNDKLAIPDITSEECPFCEGPTRLRPATEVFVDLAAEMGARLEFLMQEENPNDEQPDDVARTLIDEFDGVAGLPRF